MSNNYIIKISNLTKNYNFNNENLLIIDNLSISFEKNCIVSIIGPSGSGKSTLLNILGLLDRGFEGNYEFNSKNIKNITNKQINKIRGTSIGFVHQFFHLIPELNVIENVVLPNLINLKEFDAYEKAIKLLELFGLKDRINFKPI